MTIKTQNLLGIFTSAIPVSKTFRSLGEQQTHMINNKYFII